MSVEFDASGSADEGIEDDPITPSLSLDNVTMACRFKMDATQTDAVARFLSLGNASTSGFWSFYYASSNGTLRLQAKPQGASGKTVTIGSGRTDTWITLIAKAESGTSVSVWRNYGAGVVREEDNTTYPGGLDITGEVPDSISIGGRDNAAQDWDGSVADVAVWDGRLSDDQCEAYANGMSPLALHSAPLAVHWTGRHDIYRDEMQGTSFANMSNQATATLVLDDNPPTIFPE